MATSWSTSARLAAASHSRPRLSISARALSSAPSSPPPPHATTIPASRARQIPANGILTRSSLRGLLVRAEVRRSAPFEQAEGARHPDRDSDGRVDFREADQERGVYRRDAGSEATPQSHDAGILRAGMDLSGKVYVTVHSRAYRDPRSNLARDRE